MRNLLDMDIQIFIKKLLNGDKFVAHVIHHTYLINIWCNVSKVLGFAKASYRA